MPQYLHDGSFDGLLCAVSAALQNGTVDDIVPEEQRQALLFCEEICIKTDEAVAREIAGRIRNEISKQAFRHIMYTHLSELPNLGKAVFNYISEGLHRGASIDHWHADPSVRAVHEACRKTTHEIHRLKGLLRFRELADGTLWAPVEPDHQVIIPLALHFRKRLSEEQGIIHDVKRGIAVEWKNGSVRYVDPPVIPEISLAGNEQEIQQLWQTYHRAGTIQERINPRLQKQFMPLRYWKWLTETVKPES